MGEVVLNKKDIQFRQIENSFTELVAKSTYRVTEET